MQFHVEGMVNVLRYFGVIPGEPVKVIQHVSPERLRLHSEHDGIWYSRVALDQKVSKGCLVGLVSDPFGHELQLVKAPEDGVVSMMRSHYSVRKGEMLLIVST